MKNGQKTDKERIEHIRGIANQKWTVYDSYEFGTRKVKLEITLRDNEERRRASESNASFDEDVAVKAIVNTSLESTSYFLSGSKISESLLLDYLNIYDEAGALSFVRKWGYLDESDFEFYPQLGFRFKGCLVSEILDSSSYLRWLVELSDLISSNNIKKIDSLVKHGPRNGKDVPGTGCVVVYIRDDNKNAVYPFVTQNDPGLAMLSRGEEEPLIYQLSEWQKLGKEKGIVAAQDYLRCAMMRLLQGVQPILEWKRTLGGERVLEESIMIESPWQAICYALLQYFTKKSHLISCKNCSDRFRSTRKDNLFCSDACRKAQNRKSTDRVHSSTKKGKVNKK